MDIDINDVRGFSTVLVFFAFMGVCWWAFAPRRKARFDEAANLPFADEHSHERTQGSHEQIDSHEPLSSYERTQAKQADVGDLTGASSENEKRDTL